MIIFLIMPKRINNRTNRWKYWNYSSPGIYFLTMVISEEKHLLGVIQDKTMVLSKCGNVIKDEFIKMKQYYNNIELDEWIIMPNHIHFIIVIKPFSFPDFNKTKECPYYYNIKQYRRLRRGMLIPRIVSRFLMQTSKQINIINNTQVEKTGVQATTIILFAI